MGVGDRGDGMGAIGGREEGEGNFGVEDVGGEGWEEGFCFFLHFLNFFFFFLFSSFLLFSFLFCFFFLFFPCSSFSLCESSEF